VQLRCGDCAPAAEDKLIGDATLGILVTMQANEIIISVCNFD
jgi:hypothetical protein